MADSSAALAKALKGLGQTHTLGFFFFIAVAFHLADVFLGRMGTHALNDVFFMVVYFFMGLWGGLGGLFSQEHATFIERWRVTAYLWVMGALAVVIPLLAYRLLTGFQFSNSVITFVLVFAPIYPLILFFQRGEEIGWGATFIKWYIVIWVIVLVFSNPTWFQSASASTAQLLGVTPDQVTVSPGAFLLAQGQRVVTGVQNLVVTTKNTTQQQINFATGDAFTARVDQNAKEKLGVTVNDLQLTQPTFSANDRVGVFTTLTAQTLEEPLKILVDCTAKDAQGNAIAVEKRHALHPDTSQTPIEVAQQETVDIDCDWNPATFEAGKGATITVATDFTMKTLSYLKTYLMDRDRLRELRNSKIDPFQQYGITDRTPVAIYTNGPVSIGMGFSTPPVGIDVNADEFSATLGITLTNTWPGQIKNLSTVYVLVPKGFQLAELTGIDASIKPARCLDLPKISDWCDDALTNLYILKPTINPVDTQKAVTLRARLTAGKSDYEKLLGSTPISTKYFKAAADYTYRIEKSYGITIQGNPAGTTGTANQKISLVSSPSVTPNPTDATITFTTDIASATEVKYCQGANTASCTTLSTSSAPTAVTQHTHVLSGLTPSALYTYDLFAYSSACPSGKCKLNDQPYTFATTSSMP
jgi:hypothetical protein